MIGAQPYALMDAHHACIRSPRCPMGRCSVVRKRHQRQAERDVQVSQKAATRLSPKAMLWLTMDRHSLPIYELQSYLGVQQHRLIVRSGALLGGLRETGSYTTIFQHQPSIPRRHPTRQNHTRRSTMPVTNPRNVFFSLQETLRVRRDSGIAG